MMTDSIGSRTARSAAYLLGAHGVSAEYVNLVEDARVADVMAGDDKEMSIVLSALLTLRQLDGSKTWSDAAQKAVDALSRVQGAEIRHGIKRVAESTAKKAEEMVGRSAARHFRRCVRETSEAIAELTFVPNPDNAERQAAEALDEVWGAERWHDDLVETLSPAFTGAFIIGATSQIRLHQELVGGKLTSAEELAARLEIDIPDGVSVGRIPEWMLEAARDAIADSFSQEYWSGVVETTRRDIERTIVRSIEEGWSIRRIANEILANHGTQYTRARATLVARTEATDSLNAGQTRAIEQLASELDEEDGIEMGVEWISALSNTTRPEHAEKDGDTRTLDGMFTLGGVDVPWPGHHKLDVSHRANCLCSVISTFITDLTE